MPLPGVDIELGNGSLGGQNASQDGITGMVLTGVTVTGTGNVTLGNAYQINSLADAEKIGIAAAGTNAFAHAKIKNYYKSAPVGTTLWIMLAASTISMEDMADKNKAYAPILLDAAKGKIRLLGFSKKSAAGVVIANGLDADVDKAMIKAQELRVAYFLKDMPFRFVVDGKDYNGTPGDLKDYRTTSFNGGSIFLGNADGSKNAAVGFALGTLAGLPVQRKLSRVKTGALAISSAYTTDGDLIEESEASWGAIHDKGYIIFRTFANKSGIFFSSDTTATSLTNDYSSLSNGRVIDKAHVISYTTYVEEIDDEVVLVDGRIHPAEIKALQGTIQTAVDLQMTGKGECSSFTPFIDSNQNIISTSELAIVLDLTPVGYKSKISIKLGLKNPAL